MTIAGLKNLCTPAYLYLVISMIALFIMAFQNIGNANVYCLGAYECNVFNTTLLFVLKFIYILFWTWILNLMCKSGQFGTSISWFFVLFPFILMFILIGMMFVYRT